MILDEVSAREILDVAHAAWSNNDVEGALRQCFDDVVYWSNTGAPDGAPLEIVGKAAFGNFLRSIAWVAESASVTEHFKFFEGVGRAKVEWYIKHRQTGIVLSDTYRQVVTYRERTMFRITEYHDDAKMAAFWRLISGQPEIHAGFESELHASRSLFIA